MTNLEQAATLALDALTYIYTDTTADEDELIDQAITAIKEALEQPPLPVQEPVAWNKNIRDRVDSLLEQAGYQPDSSARNALSMMDFATPPLPVQEPVACRFCFSEKGCWTWQCYHCGEIDDVQKPAHNIKENK